LPKDQRHLIAECDSEIQGQASRIDASELRTNNHHGSAVRLSLDLRSSELSECVELERPKRSSTWTAASSVEGVPGSANSEPLYAALFVDCGISGGELGTMREQRLTNGD
jgi:hypothetical protein